MVLPQLSAAQASGQWDYQTIIDQLTRVYDNPNKVQDAEERMMAIRQGEDSLSQYLAKFERVRYEARANTWPDHLVISVFRKGLSAKLRDRQSQQHSPPTTYSAYVQLVQQLASHSSYNTSTSHNQSHHPPGTTPMDIGNVNTISTTLEQRSERRRAGLCVRCGQPGHWVKDCQIAAYATADEKLA